VIKHLVRPGILITPSQVQDYTMATNLALHWDFEEEIDVGLIGVPFGKGTHIFKGTSEAPDAIRETFQTFASRSFDFEVDIRDLRVRDIGDIQMHPTDVVECQNRIEEALTELYSRFPHFLPLIIGGDHTIITASVRAFKRGRSLRKIGIIQFDSHNDLRNPAYDGPGSATPIRRLIDGGDVEGRNIVQVGLHGFLSSGVLKEYADSVGLRMVSARELRRRGIREVVDEALREAAAGTDAVYASFDIDVLDGVFAPGTGGHTPGGIYVDEAIEALWLVGQDPRVKAIDFVEVDPIKDVREVTTRTACMLILTFLVGFQERFRSRER
jgi:formiminoglutamase